MLNWKKLHGVMSSAKGRGFIFIVFLGIFCSVVEGAYLRVAFLGDSICYGAHWPSLIEGGLSQSKEFKNADIVNFGLPSESAAGLSEPGHAGGRFPRPSIHERLGRVLSQYKPDLVLACYGMNDGLMMPLSPERFAAYKEGMTRLKSSVEKSGARIIFITPSPYLPNNEGWDNEYNKTLDAYSKWLVEKKKAGWAVVDMRPVLKKAIEKEKKKNPQFNYAGDGVHPGPEGHRMIAESIWPALAKTLKISPDIRLLEGASHEVKLKIHREKMNQWLEKTKHIRPEIPGYDPALAAEAQITVACLGDSITFGAGVKTDERWSSCLAQKLGPQYKIENCGVSGRTLLDKGDYPYTKDGAYKRALALKPDVAIIALGTNDSKPQNWRHKEDFSSNYKALIKSLRAANPQVKIYCLQAVPAYLPPGSISDVSIRGEINPLIAAVAKEMKCELIDLYTPLLGKKELLPDQVHPNATGHALMASNICAALTGKMHAEQIRVADWHGFSQKIFHLMGRECYLVSPKTPAKGSPWIWRTEFFGHEPQTDIALLEKGYHVAYIDLQNLYGSPASVRLMNDFYAYLRTEYSLAPKVVLEGFSRGGLFAFNWAVANPQKVAALYVDAPVCDIKSWPGGKGKGKGSPEDWAQLLQVYGMTEKEALSYNKNPIDTIPALTKARVPIVAVVGEVDDVVPVAENMNLIEKRYKALKGNILIIRKKGVNHHPHSLKDPTPIVQFITQYGK